MYIVFSYTILLRTNIIKNDTAQMLFDQANTEILSKIQIDGALFDRNGIRIAATVNTDENNNQDYYMNIKAEHDFASTELLVRERGASDGILPTIVDKTRAYVKQGVSRSFSHLTIDAPLQEYSYNFLDSTGDKGAVVILKNNELLVLTSNSSFDFNSNYEDYKALTSGEFMPLNFFGVQPGSVGKLLSSIALIESNPGIEEETYLDVGSKNINNREFHNYNRNAFGEINLQKALVHSSNLFFIENIEERIPFEALKDTARSLGLTTPFKTEFGTLYSSYGYKDKDGLLLASFGQGDNLKVPPFLIARLVYGIFNQGSVQEPYVLSSISNTGKLKMNYYKYKERESDALRVMDEKTAAILKEAMIATADKSTFNGNKIGYKTGTAEVDEEKNNAWIAGGFEKEGDIYSIVLLLANTNKEGVFLVDPLVKIANKLEGVK